MNQDNNGFELSGTLGSLNNAALDSLTKENSNETVTNEQNNLNIENNVVLDNTSTEIEMLDVGFGANVLESTSTQESQDAVVNQPESSFEQLTANENDNLNLGNTVVPNQDFNPIQTNFDIGDIGSVPPVDSTKKPKNKKKNSVLFIIILIIIILAVGGLIFYYLRVSKGTLANAVETKEINLEMGEELSTNINDYATFKAISSSNCILNTKSVDVNKAGTYEYSISCGSKVYKGNVNITDSLAPIVKTKTIVKKLNETVSPENFISSCDESSECTYAFENSEVVTASLAAAGTYDFNIIVSDSSNNTVTVPVKLIVMDVDIKVYLNCVLEEQVEEGFNGTINLIDKIGISNDTSYAGIYFNTKEYIATSEEEYNRIKTEYTTNNILSINGGVGIPTFDDNNLTITIEEIMSGEAEFGDGYSAIKTHYETTKNYRCNIVNVN